MNPPVIQLRDVEKTYQSEGVVTEALRGVNLVIGSGEFVALMGPSGSGKSTMMHMMGFLDRPTAGQYLFRDRDVSRLSDDELAFMRRSEVGFVFQSFHLLAKSKVVDNVMLPMMYAGVPAEERRPRALEALADVGLSHRVDYLSNRLSGGERQRVAIARALANRPAVLFADEPTGNLDSKSGSAVLGLLQELHRKGTTVIMVTHETEAAEYAERIVRVRDGKIVDDAANHSRRMGAYEK